MAHSGGLPRAAPPHDVRWQPHAACLSGDAGRGRSRARLRSSPDVRALVTTLIQTDRFGTSIATALRMHSETLRTERRQRAEEQAAKTTIKMVVPLAVFILPSIIFVTLGPAMIQLFRQLSQGR